MHHTIQTLLAALVFQLTLFYLIFKDFERSSIPYSSLSPEPNADADGCPLEPTGPISEARAL